MTFPPERLWPNRLDREWTGFKDATRTLSPWEAQWYASPAAATVFPTPPFPPVKMYRIFGRCSRSSGRVVTRHHLERGSEGQVLGHPLDHVESARFPRVHREHRNDLPRELRFDFIEIFPLHPRAVPEELDRFAAFRLVELRRAHLVHYQPPHRNAGCVEYLERVLHVPDRHFLRDHYHHEVLDPQLDH